jgi:hypothetical protein
MDHDPRAEELNSLGLALARFSLQLAAYEARLKGRRTRQALSRRAERQAILASCPTAKIHSLLACEGHRYSSVTCPNRRSRCLSLNLPISKSVVRLNATEPAWPNTFQSPCARCIAAAGLGQSMGSPAAMPPSLLKSKGKATKRVISAIRSRFVSLPLAHSARHRLNRLEAPRFLVYCG